MRTVRIFFPVMIQRRKKSKRRKSFSRRVVDELLRAQAPSGKNSLSGAIFPFLSAYDDKRKGYRRLKLVFGFCPKQLRYASNVPPITVKEAFRLLSNALHNLIQDCTWTTPKVCPVGPVVYSNAHELSPDEFSVSLAYNNLRAGHLLLPAMMERQGFDIARLEALVPASHRATRAKKPKKGSKKK